MRHSPLQTKGAFVYNKFCFGFVLHYFTEKADLPPSEAASGGEIVRILIFTKSYLRNDEDL